ncbi:hypothetical protein CC86DRAFT_453235 [Ophiobolus disseminans]|uniref:Uncharacterized protein n=1 Tax=Ophiobolus disseminans TaxID=1469910 RepID=A0A6A7AAD5_9PLEO|nr:hypothetical protein CC86DRAFT_453235 [Ophiobolus disseminans]
MSFIISSTLPDVAISTWYGTGSYTTDMNVPPLLTVFTPGTDCRGRWLFYPRSSALTVYSTSPDSRDTTTDPLYLSCQPLSSASVYSPGVCPSGYTMAAVTQRNIKYGSNSLRYWDANCCPSGMGFYRFAGCGSSFSTPFQAFAPVTIRRSPDGSSLSEDFFYYSYLTASLASSGTPRPSSTTITNTTILARGFAIADAIYIQWEVKDLPNFPVAYATSLASRIGVSFTPSGLSNTASPATFSRLATETNPGVSEPPPSSSGLSTGAKAGIGVGAVVGAAVIIGIGILALCLRRRRRRRVTVGTAGNELPEMVVKRDGEMRRE